MSILETSPAYDPYSALRNIEFRSFVSARLCLTLGIQMQSVIVGWQVYELTKNPFSLGLIGLFEGIPFLVVSLFSGHVADTVNRKKIISLTTLILFICSVFLWLLVLDSFTIFPDNKVALIYQLIFIIGIARGFIGPALFAFMPQIIKDRSLYGNAISWNSWVWQFGTVVGPAVGGLIFGLGGYKIVYLLIAVLVLIALILFLRIPSKPLPLSSDTESVSKRLTAGIRFVFANELILTAISLDLFAVLFGGAIALLPIYASEILNVGAIGLGFLRACPGIGALVMMIWMAYHPIRKNAGKKMLWSVAGFGLTIIIFGISEIFWLSCLMLILSGAFDSISVIVRHNLVHLQTPEHLKGRVSAVNNIFIGSSNELGAFESGTLAGLIGTIPAVVTGGIITLLITSVAAIKGKKLRNLDLQ